MKVLARTKLNQHNNRHYVELRDYEIKDQTSVKVIHCLGDPKTCKHDGEEYMRLTTSQLKKGKVINTQKSQFYPYAYYKMLEYLWKPEGFHSHIEYNFDGNVATIK